MFDLAEQCVTQRVQGRTVILLHVIHNVEPFVVEGFKLVISIIIEQIQMANNSLPLMKSPLFPYSWFFMDMPYFTCMDLSPALSMTFLN